ncbi:hypothetical protein [Pseudonocardia sp. NPDC049635]|uniref:hypothetical protein n=1 Tax=Pseudonocardia sp. NPDC049635 TaxID=3155506 RepID=UPI0033F2A3B0
MIGTRATGDVEIDFVADRVIAAGAGTCRSDVPTEPGPAPSGGDVRAAGAVPEASSVERLLTEGPRTAPTRAFQNALEP